MMAIGLQWKIILVLIQNIVIRWFMEEDFKLELMALQKKDTMDANEQGFFDKDSWFKHIINADKDIVAESIIDLAKRYDIKDTVVAYYFDPTMLIRLSKVKNDKKKMALK